MNGTDVLRRLHDHRIWANHRVFAACRALTDEQLRRNLPIGQGSAWKTLVHLFAAEFVWLETLEGNESPVAPGDLPGLLPGNQQGERPIADRDDLGRLWGELDSRWRGHLSGLTDSALEDEVYKLSTGQGGGRRLKTRRADILMHVCTHAQYTTAQLVNMLRQLGQEELPDVMLISKARQELG